MSAVATPKRSSARDLLSAAQRRHRTLASAAAALLLASSLVALSNAIGDDPSTTLGAGTSKASTGSASDQPSGPASNDADASDVGGANPTAGDSRTPSATGSVGSGGSTGSGSGPGGGTTPAAAAPTPTVVGGGSVGGTIPPGVTDKEILVAYYWKGDRTMTSPYLKGSGQEGNVDEGKAFMGLINYINAHPNGDADFMGVRFNLHGRKLKGLVLEAGQYPDTYAQTAEKLAKEIKPFAAVSSHGSLSAYICPRIARAGIHNVSTYDLGGNGGNLVTRTDGYCTPAGMSWEQQVKFATAYLAKHAATTRYEVGPGQTQPRVYGVIYVEYPGLVDSAPRMVEGLKAAGVPVAEVATLAPDLGTSQQQAGGVVAKMRAKGVNTIVMPDAGAGLNFTHSSQANGYTPDYFVWPCSGQDSIGMVRLYNAAQWARASGLTCYDREFNADLANSSLAKRTQWYRHYQEGAGNVDDAPSPTPYIYQSLHELLVGVTNAGRNLTVESYRAGLKAFGPYRYDAVDGRVDDPTNMLLTLNQPDHSPIGDVVKLYWSPTAVDDSSAGNGAYVYPEKRRYLQAEF